MAELDDILALSIGASKPKKAAKPRRVDKPANSKATKSKALIVLDDALEGRGKSEAANYPMKATVEAYRNFEQAVGSRQDLVDTLQHCPDDSPKALVARKLLQDQHFLTQPSEFSLFVTCQKHKITLAGVIMAFRDARAAQLSIQAMNRMAEEAPTIVEQVVNDAKNRFDSCTVCEGSARVRKLSDNGEWMKGSDGKIQTQLCYSCRGTGKVFKEHDPTARKQLLQITGILDEKRMPLVQQTFNQNATVLKGDFVPGDGSFEDLIKAIDAVAHPGRLEHADIIDNIEIAVYDEPTNPEQ